MQITFEKTNWDALSAEIAAYLNELGKINDGFHHDMVFDAEPYRILLDGTAQGFFALGGCWDGDTMVTAFWMPAEMRRHCDAVFTALREELQPAAALVPSNDSVFISLVLTGIQEHGKVTLQAYNYVGGTPTRPAAFSRDCMQPVQPEEYAEMNRLTEGQWDGCFDRSDFQFYALRQNGETLGYGAIAGMRYNEGYADIGNFTLPQHRQKGVGRSLLIHLSDIVREQGRIPRAGCWSGNWQSILTIGSSGMIPQSRLFYVRF